MPSLLPISNHQLDTQTVEDHLPPTRTQIHTALQEALITQHDNHINQLLNRIRHEPRIEMAGVVGEIYFEANEHQRLAIDIWSAHLSADQLSCFEARREDARSMAYSRLLTIALQKPHDRLLSKLLDVANTLDNVRIFQLIGIHYADAQPTQKEKINAWRSTLSDQQARDCNPLVEPKERHLKQHVLPFLSGNDLARASAASKGLKQAIQQEPSLSGRLLSHRISRFISSHEDAENNRLRGLLKEITELKEQPLQLDLMKQLVEVIAGLEDKLDRREIADLLEFTNSTLSMASRASLLETVAEHFPKLEGKEKRTNDKSQRYQRSIRWFNDNPLRENLPGDRHFCYSAPSNGVVRSFLKSLNLLDSPELRIQPLVALMKNRVGNNMNEQYWPMFAEAVLAIQPEPLLHTDFEHFLDALALSSDYVAGADEMVQRLEGIIEHHQEQGRLSEDKRLELLSKLLPIDDGGNTQTQQIQEQLLSRLRSGLRNHAVALNLAAYIGRLGNSEQFEALALYIEDAPEHRQAEQLAIALSKPLRLRLNTCLKFDLVEELLPTFRMALRSLPLLPRLERGYELGYLIRHFSKAVGQPGRSFYPAYRSIHDLPRREKSDMARQLQNVANGLPNIAFGDLMDEIRRLAA